MQSCWPIAATAIVAVIGLEPVKQNVTKFYLLKHLLVKKPLGNIKWVTTGELLEQITA